MGDAVKAAVLIDVLAALRLVETSPHGVVPNHLWLPVHHARMELDAALAACGLDVPVELPAPTPAVAAFITEHPEVASHG